MDFPHSTVYKTVSQYFLCYKNRVDPSLNRFGFYACYKNQVIFYKVQKSSRFLLKSYKNRIGFYGCYKN